MLTLTPNAVLPDRIFTHPQHTTYDRRVLAYTLVRLCRLFETGRIEPQTQPIDLIDLEPDGRSHRILVFQPQVLFPSVNHTPFSVVGFFGQRQVGTQTEALQSRDDLLVEMMQAQEGPLSYSTIELTCGNFANCILFVSEEAKIAWGANPLHRELARDLSPRFYYSVRLYNGTLSGGITRPETLELHVVKYFDYRSRPPWRAQRTLDVRRNS